MLREWCEQQQHTCDLILNHGVPVLANLPWMYVVLSPWIAVREMERTRQIGAFDVLPCSFLAITSLSWLLYGILVRNYHLYVPNMIGFLSCTYFVMSAVRFASERHQYANLYTLTAGYTVNLVVAMVCFLTLMPEHERMAVMVMGGLNIFTLIVMSASPLLNMVHIIQTKNSECIYVRVTVGVWLTGVLYVIYGFILHDLYVVVPNVICFVTASLQLFLVLIYPTTAAASTDLPKALP